MKLSIDAVAGRSRSVLCRLVSPPLLALLVASTGQAAAASTPEEPPVAPAEPAAPAAPAAAAAASSSPVAPSAAPAEASAPVTSLNDVAVTGTAISRPDAATALPVTTYKTEDLRKEGITSTPQFLQRLAGNSTGAGSGLSTGTASTGGSAFADLRGLGANKTLILLNGRRLTVNAADGGAVDLNTIPFAAIDHVEVLRDGASALYGTDAIGGVINFITKKNLDGGNVDLNYSMPTRDGGGNKSTLSATFGKGDFARDGWNIMGTLSYQRQDAINSNTRGFVTPLDSRISALSSNTFPAQYLQPSTGVGFIHPQGNSGCDGPTGLVDNGTAPSCAENYTALGTQVQQKYEQPSFFGRGSYRINDHNKVTLSYLWTRKTTYNSIAPASTTVLGVDPGTPFYPGNGVTPLPASSDFDPSAPLTLHYRSNPLGPRVDKDVNEYHRAILDFSGDFFGGFHYDTALSYNQGTTEFNQVNGFFNGTNGADSLQAAIDDGRYNPFDPNPSADELTALQSTETNGRVESDKTRAYVWDGKINHDLGDWFGAGQAALAMGAQYRHETLTSDLNADVINNTTGSGVLSTADVDESRDVEGVFGELNVPLLDNLEIDAQARYDNYSDVGDTLNPKVSLRYQPFRQLTLRASYSEGFHAPTLYDLYQPQAATFTGNGDLNDPVLCPGGTPAAGGVAARDCGTEFQVVTGGNPNLKPETSKSWSAGFVLQPTTYISITADFWAVELSQQIGTVSDTYVFDHYDEFSGNFNRDPDNGSIINFQNVNYNLGKTVTNGEDVQVDMRLPTTTGTYTLSMNGTYTNKYVLQTAEDSDYVDNVSHYANGGNMFRWKHNITLGWHKGPVSLGVVNHYASGYMDADSTDAAPHKVNAYVTWDTYGSYRFDNGVQFTVGADNVFDRDPPFSRELDAGNPGYDARYASGVGRVVYGRFSYDF